MPDKLLKIAEYMLLLHPPGKDVGATVFRSPEPIPVPRVGEEIDPDVWSGVGIRRTKTVVRVCHALRETPDGLVSSISIFTEED